MSAGRRNPYVGAGADGCRRSAQVDREEADTLDELNPRREVLAMSALAWELQAELEGAATVGELAGMFVEPGVSAFDGLPFCRVTAKFAGGSVAAGQVTPAVARTMGLNILEMAAAAEFDAALFAMLTDQGTTPTVAAVALGELRAKRVEHHAALEFRDELETFPASDVGDADR